MSKKEGSTVLEKLRKRFVVMTLGFTAFTLALVLIVSCVSMYKNLDNRLDVALSGALAHNKTVVDVEEPAARSPHESIHLGVYVLDITHGIESVGNVAKYPGLALEDMKEAIHAARTSDKEFGINLWHSFAWKRLVTETSTRLAIVYASDFIDTFVEITLISTGLLICCQVCLALYVSYRSKQILSPVSNTWVQQHQFISDASHELKTPIAIILANLEILKTHGQNFNDADRRWIDVTFEEAQRMKNLTESLLELAKIDELAINAPAASQFADVDFSSLVENACLECDALCFDRQCTLEEHIQEGLHLKGSQQSLDRLIRILIDNASKFAAENTIVTVTLKNKDRFVCLSVNNYGTPVPPEDRAHLFDRFYRADKARTNKSTDKQKGYGLGLAIAKSIVELHSGSITCTSDEEHGTTFTVLL